ncbi:uncharacterized protein PAC_01471 [Phialocephala subalpina]|uniref:2EXR domain-containing protein n=1 Tax=Phialocephala subalpina TaxID=576137 RepID=A0A1L7WFQ1_9HELO|nr:uncharacterized protein PAC_01471 [Phialocephala subalpina]
MVQTRSQTLALKNTFHLFPSFSPEIRLLIWELSLPTTPQLIPHSILRIPPIAYVSHESRAIYKRHYTSTFPRIEDQSEPPLQYPMAIDADLSKDILFISWDLFEGSSWELNWNEWITEEAIAKIQHIAIDADMWRGLDPEYGGLRSDDEEVDYRKILLQLPNLKTLRLVLLPMEDIHQPWMSREDIEDPVEAQRTRDLWKKELVPTTSQDPKDSFIMLDINAFLDEHEHDPETDWIAPKFEMVVVKETKVMSNWLWGAVDLWQAGGVLDTIEENYILANKHLDA